MTILHFLLFLQCLTTVHAGLFSSSNPYIAAEPVTLYSNTSSIDNVDPSIEPQNYKQNIIPNSNLTQPDASGLAGVLYDRGLSCQPQSGVTPPTLLTKQRKIALVKRGNCTFAEKVIYSQMDGAVGVIIYDDIPFEKDPRAGLMDIPPGNISIVAYYVDLDIGLNLLGKLQQSNPVMQVSGSNVSYQTAVKVILYPAIGGFPSAWEFTLIVVVALLAISFLASVGMHYHLWRIRRRQRALLLENGLLPPQFTAFTITTDKKVIEPDMLAVFPTRIIGHDDSTAVVQQEHERRDSTRSGKALENAEALAVSSETRKRNNIAARDENTPKGEQENDDDEGISTTQANNDQQREDTCVICLDDFASGEQVRKLPCGHEYHCECIDPWLTIKSAACPLCKHDCSLDIPKSTTTTTTTEEENHIEPPTPAATSPLRLLGRNNQAFGPTISADRAQEFSQSWVARSLPRNMRRQIATAAAAATTTTRQQEDNTVIELPARMRSPEVPTPTPTPDTTTALNDSSSTNNNPSPRNLGLAARIVRSLPHRRRR